MQEINSVANFIKEIGFPIFIAIYVLVRVDTSVKALTASINDLKNFLEGHTK